MQESHLAEVNDQLLLDLGLLGIFHPDQGVRDAASTLNWRLIEIGRAKRKEEHGKSEDRDHPH